MSEREIFLAALNQPSAGERAAFLDKACGSDATLRRQIEALLAEHEKLGSYLESPVAVGQRTLDQPPVSELPGTSIGAYKLLQQIGEGGMGTVFMAEQLEPVQRRVALKIIKAGMDSKPVIARFEAERQALAMMDHVNIARVFDGGATENGRPYFVMELVHGVPITKYCDDNQLTPRQRLELFVPVCQAIQHAHQKGIIHRDIKPSNVMITLYDGKPVPKVIDFGVAKATEQKLTERTLFTQYGTMVGTLEYMSPEQAEMSALGVDTRSDIYSLGVLLYELLTGSTPLTHKRMTEAVYAEILRMIKEEEPPKPSTRLTDSGEALASISAQRHMEPAKLTKLVRGELDWIVMKSLEKDRNRRYETANGLAHDIENYLHDDPVQACPPSAWYRFHKFSRRNKRALLTGMLLGVLLLVAAGAIAGSIGWVAREREVRLAETAGALNEALNKATELQQEEKWPEALAVAQRAEALLPLGVGSPVLQRPVHELVNDLQMVADLEEIRLRRSAVRGEHFDSAGADADYALKFAEHGIDLKALEPSEAARRIRGSAIQQQLVAAVAEWIWVRQVNHIAGGEGLQEVYRQADPAAWRDQLRQALASKDTGSVERVIRSPEVVALPPGRLVLLASALEGAGKLSLAVEVLRQAQRRHPGDFWINHDLAAYLCRLGPSYVEEAIRFFTAAVALRPDSPGAHNNLGIALCATGKLDEAIATYGEAIRIKPDFAWAHYNLGSALRKKGKVDEAIATYHETIRLQPNLAEAHNNLGDALQQKGKADEAIAAYRAAIRINPNLAQAHYNLGDALRQKGNVDEALAEYKEAIRLKPDYVKAHSNLGALLCDVRRDYDGAITAFREAIRLQPDDAVSHFNLGNAFWHQGRLEEAIAAWQEAIRLKLDLPEAHQYLGVALGTLAWRLATDSNPRSRNPRRAVELAKQAVELAPKDGNRLLILGLAQYRAGDCQAALAALEKAMPLRKGGDPSDGFLLAMVHWQLGDKEKARQEYDRATKLMATHSHEGWLQFREEAASLLDLPRLVEFRNIPYTLNAPPFTINVLGVAFCPDGRRVLATGDGNDLRLFEVETAKETGRFTGHTHWVQALALSSDGRLALSGGPDKTLRLWDMDRGKEVRQFTGHTTPIAFVAFSPDGKQALSGGADDLAIRLWDVETGKVTRQFTGHKGKFHNAAFSPSGREVLSANADKTIRLWSVETGEEIRRFQDPGTTTYVCFSPDGEKALSAGPDDAAPRLWDVATGKLLRRLEGLKDKSDPPHEVVFTPDGRDAVSAHDRKVRLWDVSTGKELYWVELDRLHPNHVAISADGRWVASANWRGSVSVWKLIDPRPRR